MSLFEQTSRPPWPWQEAVWRRLHEQEQSGAMAHAYLFIGDRGTGRTDFVREFANFLLCDDPESGRACYRCRSCRAGGADHHPDLLSILPEEGKKDIGVGQIRELTEFLSLNSFSGSGRVAIIPQAEALTLSASNALLKTLEEPAAGATLLLTAYSPGSLLPTIRSRCQLLGLPGPDFGTAIAWLRERLPDSHSISDERLRELLEAYGNRPLELAPALSAGQAPGFVALRKMLLDLLEGKISILRAAAEAAKIGESEVFEHLSRVSTILIRGLVNGDVRGAETRALAAALPESGELGFLLEFHRQVTRARKLLAGPGNPNPQLLLESTFRLWVKADL
ncbi:MAG: hypothetical protein OXI13_05650 [Gammaproteobacteria bacterium]|nr:hypothetical protein [Gammaproteobacteria bacterium]